MANKKRMIRDRGTRSGQIAFYSPEPTRDFLDDLNSNALGVYKGFPIGEVIDVRHSCRISVGEIREPRADDAAWSIFVIATTLDEPPAYTEMHLHFGFVSEIAAQKFYSQLLPITVSLNTASTKEKVRQLCERYLSDKSDKAGLGTLRRLHDGREARVGGA